MRTLILGDTHNNFKRAEAAINQIPHDKVVFVGDYFDSLGDGRNKAGKTADWLKKSLSIPNRIHLFGNHDIPYFNPKISCPGWDDRKGKKVSYIMGKEDWVKLKFHTWVDQFLVTHAGLHPCYLPKTNNLDKVKEWLVEQEQECIHVLQYGNGRIGFGSRHKHWILDRSMSRGGIDTFPGILWQDWFKDFASMSWDFYAPKVVIHQIVGHTPSGDTLIKKKYWHGSTNYCVDCMWGACMVIEDGKEEFWSNNWEAYKNRPNKLQLTFKKIEDQDV